MPPRTASLIHCSTHSIIRHESFPRESLNHCHESFNHCHESINHSSTSHSIISHESHARELVATLPLLGSELVATLPLLVATLPLLVASVRCLRHERMGAFEGFHRLLVLAPRAHRCLCPLDGKITSSGSVLSTHPTHHAGPLLVRRLPLAIRSSCCSLPSPSCTP